MKTVSPAETEFNSVRSHLEGLIKAVVNQVHALHEASFAKKTAELRAIIDRDPEIDRLEVSLGKMSMLFVEQRAPLGPDFRYVMGVIDIARSLERVGDCVEYVARHMVETVDAKVEFPQAWVLLQDMAGKCSEILDRVYATWRDTDAKAARAIPELDDAVDALQKAAYKLITTEVRANHVDVEWGLKVMLMVNKLESIGDIVCHIAETLVFMFAAKDIRHGLAKEPKQLSGI